MRKTIFGVAIMTIALTMSLCACGDKQVENVKGTSESVISEGKEDSEKESNNSEEESKPKCLTGNALEEKGYHRYSESSGRIIEDYSNLDRDLTEWPHFRYERFSAGKKGSEHGHIWMKVAQKSNLVNDGSRYDCYDYNTGDLIEISVDLPDNYLLDFLSGSHFFTVLPTANEINKDDIVIDYSDKTNEEIADLLLTKDETQEAFMKCDAGWNNIVIGRLLNGILSYSRCLEDFDLEIIRTSEEECNVGIYENCYKCVGELSYSRNNSSGEIKDKGTLYYCFYIARLKYSDGNEPFVWGYGTNVEEIFNEKDLTAIRDNTPIDLAKEYAEEYAYRSGITLVEDLAPYTRK